MYNVSNKLDDSYVSKIARIGSGSACRSIFGGFVRWYAGTTHDTSICKQVFPSKHWNNLQKHNFQKKKKKKKKK